jgi:hypothetical protein
MFKKFILILCVLGILGNNFAANLYHNDEITILAGSTNGYDKSSSILARIDGHYLTIGFTENLGEVSIEIKNEAWVTLNIMYIETPSGLQFYIPLAGRYTVLLKLPNGDEYSGDFEVED